MLWFLIAVIVISSILIIGTYSFKAFAITNAVITVIWLIFPGYDTGLGGWLFLDAIVLGIIAFGIMHGPASMVKTGAAGVGGYMLGRWLGKQ